MEILAHKENVSLPLLQGFPNIILILLFVIVFGNDYGKAFW